MRLLPRQMYRRSPWKNGGGETAEIAVFPANASLDAFDWRISMATVASSGAFSGFPEIDRTLSVISRGSIELDFEQNAVTLDATSPPYAFAADVPVFGRLTGQTITDLNVMTRRGKTQHTVVKHPLNQALSLTPQDKVVLIFAQDAEFIAQCGTQIETVHQGDTLRLADATIKLIPTQSGTILIITLWQAD
eukprot:gene14093-14212_t